MGTIDQNITLLTCPRCQKSETLTAFEKGSNYGSSGWGNFNNSKHFEFESQDRDHLGPLVISAICKQCNCDVIIKNG